MKRTFFYPIIILILFGSVSCQSNKDKLFTSLSYKRTGIDFKNLIRDSEGFSILDYGYLYNGGGVSIGDINNDNLPDIYFCGNFTPSKLYLNKGDLKFKDITDKAGAGSMGTWNTGATMADINGDGFLDIYVCSSTDGRSERRKNLLFINNGDLTFTESAAKYGIDESSYSTHSTFFDYDKDGDLDLLVMNHSLDKFAIPRVEHKKEHDQRFENRLYKNNGGKFVDVTKESGMITNIMNFGLGAAVADFNNDNWPDIYIAMIIPNRIICTSTSRMELFLKQLEKYFDHVPLSSMGI